MTLRLGASEAELVIAALRLLRSTLGREEADELTEVMALLARLERARDDAAAKQR
jgi:hypothetical protein